MPPASMGSLVVKQLCAMSWNRSRQQQQQEEEASSSHTSEVRRMRWPTVPIGSDRGTEMCKIVQITVDSGAAASVAPSEVFEHACAGQRPEFPECQWSGGARVVSGEAYRDEEED